MDLCFVFVPGQSLYLEKVISGLKPGTADTKAMFRNPLAVVRAVHELPVPDKMFFMFLNNLSLINLLMLDYFTIKHI